jgi:hypothetical protein
MYYGGEVAEQALVASEIVGSILATESVNVLPKVVGFLRVLWFAPTKKGWVRINIVRKIMPRWVVNLYNVRISFLARSLGQFLAVRCTRLRNQMYSVYKCVKGGENHSSESQTDQVSLGEPEIRRVTTAGQYPV